ncbi:MAG: response regulator transcription factor [Bacteroidaceae bacterium]|nr:response regulator transcription factor [Bacteroidaceae bacterium]
MNTEERKEEVNILLCEDDESLGMLLREYLEAKGYNTTLAQDGEEGHREFLSNKFDLCILDVMMPRMDGFTLATKIREINYDMPFMFLTAKNMKDDIRSGFELGADDYITKPFSMEEVVYRIEAILRRVRGKKAADLTIRQIGKYTLDTKLQILQYEDEQTKLTTKEAELLTLLCNRQNELLPRDNALKAIWDGNDCFKARSMDVYITKLRKLLKDDPNVEILNVHGKGYKLVIADEDSND